REAEASRLAERLPGIAEHTSTTERRAERSERDLLQWKLVRFLAGRIGEEFSGRVTGVQPFGLFVQLADYYVDGLVPIRTLADDFYVFDPEAHRLVGQEKERVFRLADEVRVQLAGVNPRQRGLELKVVGMPEPRAPRRRRPRGRRGDNRRQ
ncbi:MAG: S1 RNA-binding domain-containing protein, partial [Thermoanaerobaculia bacterium]